MIHRGKYSISIWLSVSIGLYHVISWQCNIILIYRKVLKTGTTDSEENLKRRFSLLLRNKFINSHDRKSNIKCEEILIQLYYKVPKSNSWLMSIERSINLLRTWNCSSSRPVGRCEASSRFLWINLEVFYFRHDLWTERIGWDRELYHSRDLPIIRSPPAQPMATPFPQHYAVLQKTPANTCQAFTGSQTWAYCKYHKQQRAKLSNTVNPFGRYSILVCEAALIHRVCVFTCLHWI
jgi:hypothetical protein